MDYAKTLKSIDDEIATQPMTEAQFEAYATEQIAKAKKEAPEAKKKRLTHLKGVIDTVSKAVWDGDNGTQAIPLYNEPNLTADAERSEKEAPLTSLTTMGNQAWAGEGGSKDFASPGNPVGRQSGGTNAPAQLGANAWAATGGPIDFSKSVTETDRLLAEMDGTATKATQNEQPTPPAPAHVWPKDIANSEFMKDGVTKSDSLWGKDNSEAPGQ